MRRATIVITSLLLLAVAGVAVLWFWLKDANRPGFHYDIKAVAGSEAHDTITPVSWIMVDGSNGMVLAERESERRMYPASMTKMMTCILAIESRRWDDTVHVDRAAATTESSHVRQGDRYLLRDLLVEMMLNSDNGAALAIASHVADGDTTAFYRSMNEKAKEIGMVDTHFANPHGLPDTLNYSTARDMMVLARYCMRDTMFARIVATNEANVPLIDGRTQPSHNSNYLLERYEGCHGIKTGFTNLAGGCLASVATRGGHTVYLVVMNCRPVWRRIPDSASLLDYGFNLMATPYFNRRFVP